MNRNWWPSISTCPPHNYHPSTRYKSVTKRSDYIESLCWSVLVTGDDTERTTKIQGTIDGEYQSRLWTQYDYETVAGSIKVAQNSKVVSGYVGEKDGPIAAIWFEREGERVDVDLKAPLIGARTVSSAFSPARTTKGNEGQTQGTYRHLDVYSMRFRESELDFELLEPSRDDAAAISRHHRRRHRRRALPRRSYPSLPPTKLWPSLLPDTATTVVLNIDVTRVYKLLVVFHKQRPFPSIFGGLHFLVIYLDNHIFIYT